MPKPRLAFDDCIFISTEIFETMLEEMFQPLLRVGVRRRIVKCFDFAGMAGELLLNVLFGFLVDLTVF